MMEVREVLRRLSAGQALREIARATGLDRKTVRRYSEAATASGFEEGACELSETLVADVARAVQARPLPPPSEERAVLGRERDRIASWGDRSAKAGCSLATFWNSRSVGASSRRTNLEGYTPAVIPASLMGVSARAC